MKAPELNDLISESHPKKNDHSMEQLKNKIYELEQENIFYKQKNSNLEEEIKIFRNNECEYKSKLSLLMTRLNNLREENEKINASVQEMKIINQKLCEDNKILMAELELKISNNPNKNKDMNTFNENKNESDQKDKLINELTSENATQEEYIKRLFEDNKKLNENNKAILKEGENKINELNGNLEILNKEINIRDDKIVKLEENIYKINSLLEEVKKDNFNINNLNIELKEQNKKLFENLYNYKNNILILEQKNNSLIIESNKKENLINEFKEKIIIQDEQNSNLINKMDKIINNNKDSVLLINKIKTNHFDLYNKYENSKMIIEELTNYFESDNLLENILLKIKQDINNEKINNIDNFENSINDNRNCIELNDMKEYYINNPSHFNDNKKIEMFKEKNNFRNYIYENKDNEEITMDKKYDFLFKNKK